MAAPQDAPAEDRPRLTDYEMLRILDFLVAVRTPFEETVPGAEPDPNWHMLLHAIRAHLRGQPLLRSALASVAGIPFVTAMRRINRLVKDGTLVCETRTTTGKSFFVHPSQALIDCFRTYAHSVKTTLALTLGSVRSADEVDDYYFGGPYFTGKIIPPPKLVEMRAEGRYRPRFLLRHDNYFLSLRNTWADFRNNLASMKDFDLVEMHELHDRILANGQRLVSAYDVIGVNKPWVGGLAERGLVRPITDFLKTSQINPLDFHPIVWDTGNWRGEHYGIPIYFTLELLLARKDLFEGLDLPFPRTFDQVIEAARRIHSRHPDLHGVAWNAGRGMPVANSFMVFMGCCNMPVINIPRARMHRPLHDLSREQLQPNLLSDAAFAVMDYMHRLVEVSPPGILDMAWNERVAAFMRGETAMGYCWSMHAALMEYDINSVVKRRVKYLPQPAGPAGISANPVGGFLLMIPANMPDERARMAFEAISWMASPEAMKEHVRSGFPAAPRFSVTADPEAAASSPIISFVDQLARSEQMVTWQRPAVPEYAAIEAILGEEVHRALRGEVSDRVALGAAQSRIEAVMEAKGAATAAAS